MTAIATLVERSTRYAMLVALAEQIADALTWEGHRSGGRRADEPNRS